MPNQDRSVQSGSPPDARVLLVVAAASEARAVLRGLMATDAAHGDLTPWSVREVGLRTDLVLSGVGKANAAGAVAHALAGTRGGYRAVINLGIAGALPALDGPAGEGSMPAYRLPLLAWVLASRSTFADEGLVSPDGFQSLAEMGFPMIDEPVVAPGCGGPSLGLSDALARPLGGVVEARAGREGELGGVVAPVATVSTCSGTDALAAEVARRTGALAEGMEGAAAGLVCARLGVPFAELRVISNTTGERSRQRWDVRGALAGLSELSASVAQAMDSTSSPPGR
jgi:futalosine hydrolase